VPSTTIGEARTRIQAAISHIHIQIMVFILVVASFCEGEVRPEISPDRTDSFGVESEESVSAGSKPKIVACFDEAWFRGRE
jgi:hypothetical protein